MLTLWKGYCIIIIKEAAEWPVRILIAEDELPLARVLVKIFEKNNIELNNVINIHTSEMIAGSIKKDLGIGYIIYDVIKDNVENGDFQIIDIKDKLPKIMINLVYIEKYLTIAPKFFIENYLKININ